MILIKLLKELIETQKERNKMLKKIAFRLSAIEIQIFNSNQDIDKNQELI